MCFCKCIPPEKHKRVCIAQSSSGEILGSTEACSFWGALRYFSSQEQTAAVVCSNRDFKQRCCHRQPSIYPPAKQSHHDLFYHLVSHLSHTTSIPSSFHSTKFASICITPQPQGLPLAFNREKKMNFIILLNFVCFATIYISAPSHHHCVSSLHLPITHFASIQPHLSAHKSVAYKEQVWSNNKFLHIVRGALTMSVSPWARNMFHRAGGVQPSQSICFLL